MADMRIISFLMLALLLGACERVVEVDLPNGPTRLVVEARLERVLENVNGRQVIVLSTTGPYLSGVRPPAVRGTTVSVTDDLGHVSVFVEQGTPGQYVTSALVIERNRRYTLRVNWEGSQFESTTTTATIPRIDSLYFVAAKPGQFSGKWGVRATIDTKDPGDERNFYLWEQYLNSVKQLGPDSSIRLPVIVNDELVNGRPVIGYQPFEGIDIPVGTQVLIRQIGLTAELYRYYFALSEQVSNDGSIFAVPLASVRGNVANRTNPVQRALGYFSVSEVSEIRAVRR